MVGPRLQIGGNDFVVTTVLRPAAPERKHIPLLAKADEREVPRTVRIHSHTAEHLSSMEPHKTKQLVRIIT